MRHLLKLKENRGKVISKYVIFTLAMSFYFTSNLCALPIYEKLWVGMTLSDFNRMEQGEFIEKQVRKAYLTNYGIIKKDTAVNKKYFPMKSKLWKGYMVEFQNNEIKSFNLQADKWLERNQMQQIFSDLIRLHGTDFKMKTYRSLSKQGYSIIWRNHDQRISLDMIFPKQDHCQVSIRKAKVEEKISDEVELNLNAIATLEPFLGEGFQNIDVQLVDGN